MVKFDIYHLVRQLHENLDKIPAEHQEFVADCYQAVQQYREPFYSPKQCAYLRSLGRFLPDSLKPKKSALQEMKERREKLAKQRRLRQVRARQSLLVARAEACELSEVTARTRHQRTVDRTCGNLRRAQGDTAFLPAAVKVKRD